MKTPIYETSGGALEILLETNDFVKADCYTYTLSDASVMRFTSAEINITYLGHTFSKGWPKHDPCKIHSGTGLDLDSCQYKVIPRLIEPITGATFPDTIGSVAWNAAVRNGALDGATVQVDRAYAASWPVAAATWGIFVPVGVLTVFAGRVSAIDVLTPSLMVTLNDWRELLDAPFPPHAYQANCKHVLFDAGCQLVAATFAVAGTVTSSAARNKMVSAVSAPSGSGTYALGRVVMNTGANAGLARSVLTWNSGTGAFVFNAPFPYPIAAADTFTAYPGCNRLRPTCVTFGNAVNYGGFLHVPVPETAA